MFFFFFPYGIDRNCYRCCFKLCQSRRVLSNIADGRRSKLSKTLRWPTDIWCFNQSNLLDYHWIIKYTWLQFISTAYTSLGAINGFLLLTQAVALSVFVERLSLSFYGPQPATQHHRICRPSPPSLLWSLLCILYLISHLLSSFISHCSFIIASIPVLKWYMTSLTTYRAMDRFQTYHSRLR